jgi:amino acid transporter
MNPYLFFDDSGTMGTMLVLVVYFLANLALPFYYRRYRPDEFSVIKHGVLPVLGLVAVGIPVYYLVKPGQQAPLSWFPWAGLAIIVVSVVYSLILVRRDPDIANRVGSIVADE